MPSEKLLHKLLGRSNQLLDSLLVGGIAYAGYRMNNNPMDAIYAMLGYKLATNAGGASGILPNVSRVAGLTMLANIGLNQPEVKAEVKQPPYGAIKISECMAMGGQVKDFLFDDWCICDLNPTREPIDIPRGGR